MPQAEGEPVFAEPWMAQAFALAVQLHERGLFAWPDFAAALAAEIAAAQHVGDADLGDAYYRHWLAALEALVEARGAASALELGLVREAWERAAHRTPHGTPIELRPEDFSG